MQKSPEDHEELICITNQAGDVVVAVFHNPTVGAPGSSGDEVQDSELAEMFLQRVAGVEAAARRVCSPVVRVRHGAEAFEGALRKVPGLTDAA